ncbi:hypothetical protein [Streptomyces sp. MST-110588]|uniref:hypothetical protein n=1 Tax=Streptomyces sp. MST-110588 TaxID=2833628 RepID=UPI001F5DA587|nr:hypothetical protein [Streptomyces sp. MST-110588]UNO42653.1 hypothetical protein KGS77_27835 [Streptomyces sp. MST-110588]
MSRTDTSPAATRRKLPGSPVKKPSWDAWTAGKSVGVVLLLLPVLAVVGTAAQVLELLYYLVLCLFYVVGSPYWATRALWRALRPVRTPLHAERRAEARKAIRETFRGCGCVLVGLAVLAAVLVGFVLLINHVNP